MKVQHLRCCSLSPSGARTVSRDDDALLQSSQSLRVKLLKHWRHRIPRPMSLSPTSIAAAFGMAYAGARGSSEAELASVLGHTEVGLTERPRVLAAYQLLELTSSPNVTLELANLVLAQNNFEVAESYRQQLRDVFDAELGPYFANEGSRVAADVNAWVRGKTRGKITSILPEGQSLDVILFILNAVYFKGTWLTQFDPSQTKDKPFLTGTTEVSKPAMHLRRRFPYTHLDALHAGAVEIPYSGDRFSMVVLLPGSPTGLAALRDGLSLAVLEDVDSKRAEEVMFRLGKSNMTFRYSLVRAMRALGLNVVSGGGANSSAISESTQICISDPVHKVSVEVNEEGTVPTAVPGILLVGLVARHTPPPPIQFILDWPFRSCITARTNTRILFFGEVQSL
uniref:Lospin 11 n=1 Tax=Amblyomma americanum TaxID=6943 RepID=A7UI26_AMBAM|nr:lospin 11 [Amblyomma americanum]